MTAGISTWSTTPNANGTLGSTPNYWPEGQAPSTVNDCARQMMANIRIQWNDAAWFNWGYTVTRVSGNSFTVVTASWNTVTLPAAFEANGRIKLYDTNTLYGTITTVSASAASTLVTFTPDAFSLTASFSSVANSIIPATNTPIPGLNIPTNVITQTTQQIFAVDTGITNAAQITLSPTLGSYVTGQMINFKAAKTNTAATTLQVDALGTKTIKKQGGTADVAAGDIVASQIVSVIYDGTNFQLQSEIANATAPSTSEIVQRVSTLSNALATGTTAFPVDDTIPQSSEGDQYMSLSIIPTNASHILVIQVTVAGAQSNGNVYARWGCGLFQDSTLNALSAAVCVTSITNSINNTCTFTYVMTAGTTSSTTFKVRAGTPGGGGTFYFNGDAGSRVYGGIACSSMQIWEYTT